MKLKTFTYDEIMSWEPCYDPAERGYCARDWTGTALDILRAEQVSHEDRLWIVARSEVLPDRLLHDFAIWCAEQALALIDDPDPRSLKALEVKRAWLDGNATDEELSAARAAAWAAARAAALDAAWAAARAAALAAAWAAARAAAWAAAWAAALDAALDAARAAAWAAAWAAQIEQLIKMICVHYEIEIA
jgi:hypothetical protein